MNKIINLNEEALDQYFKEYFHDDLCRYFDVTNDENGNEIIRNVRKRGKGYIMSCDLLRRRPYTTLFDKNYDGPRDGTLDQEAMFIALVSMMCLIQKDDHCRQIAGGQMAGVMAKLQFPLLAEVNDRPYILKDTDVFSSTYRKKSKATAEALAVTEKYVMGIFANAVKSADSEAIEACAASIHKGVEDLQRQLLGQMGLLGMSYDYDHMRDYYENRFLPQFEQYFDVTTMPDGTRIVLSVGNIGSNRAFDGNPGDNGEENLMFTAAVIYSVLAEQSLLKYDYKSESEYQRAYGLPLIYSGPGAGPYLNPMRMLDIAGLMPLKEEALILVKMMELTATWFKEKFNVAVHGFHDARKMKAHFEDTSAQFIEHLKAWATAPEESVYDFIESNGIPIAMPYPFKND